MSLTTQCLLQQQDRVLTLLLLIGCYYTILLMITSHFSLGSISSESVW